MSIMRDDMGVLLAMVMRIDGMVMGMARELLTMHAQHSCLAARVTTLEKAG